MQRTDRHQFVVPTTILVTPIPTFPTRLSLPFIWLLHPLVTAIDISIASDIDVCVIVDGLELIG